MKPKLPIGASENRMDPVESSATPFLTRIWLRSSASFPAVSITTAIGAAFWTGKTSVFPPGAARRGFARIHKNVETRDRVSGSGRRIRLMRQRICVGKETLLAN
jgi:hypothetical protein